MPPKIKVSKEAILDAAFQVAKEKGIAFVNARELAKVLNCSTQPIFRAYTNMDELKLDLYEAAENHYNQYVQKGMAHSNPFFGIGLAYIDFARNESNLFKLLFMTEHFKITSFFDLIENEDNQPIIEMISRMTGLEAKRSKELFVDVWLITHGIASMLATNSCNLDQTEIEKILSDTFIGLKNRLKEGNE